MFYIDVKYLRFISSRLPRFKSLKGNVWNCRCILCGDSHDDPTKMRGYFYKSKESLAYKCHNCGVTQWFSVFLKNLDTELYKEYRFELYKDNVSFKKVETVKEPSSENIEEPVDESLLDSLMDRLDKLPDDNIAVSYCLNRKIPRSAFKKLYYIDDIRKVVQLNEKYRESITSDEPRIFIPYHDENNVFVGGTMRALCGESRRYVTVKVKEDSTYIFGLIDADVTKDLYVVEGPFDSLFLNNAIAVGGSTLSKMSTFQNKFKKLIYVYDNQPYNNQICKLMGKQIDNGDNIVIWPSEIVEKDINEMVEKKGLDVQKIVEQNVFHGIGAKMKFIQWRKC